MLCIMGSRIIRSKDLHVPAKGLNIVSATCSMVSSAGHWSWLSNCYGTESTQQNLQPLLIVVVDLD